MCFFLLSGAVCGVFPVVRAQRSGDGAWFMEDQAVHIAGQIGQGDPGLGAWLVRGYG